MEATLIPIFSYNLSLFVLVGLFIVVLFIVTLLLFALLVLSIFHDTIKVKQHLLDYKEDYVAYIRRTLTLPDIDRLRNILRELDIEFTKNLILVAAVAIVSTAAAFLLDVHIVEETILVKQNSYVIQYKSSSEDFFDLKQITYFGDVFVTYQTPRAFNIFGDAAMLLGNIEKKNIISITFTDYANKVAYDNFIKSGYNNFIKR